MSTYIVNTQLLENISRCLTIQRLIQQKIFAIEIVYVYDFGTKVKLFAEIHSIQKLHCMRMCIEGVYTCVYICIESVLINVL